jgi:site-specific recombinase XerD
VGRIVKHAEAVTGLDPKKYHPHLLRHCFSTHGNDNISLAAM